MGRSNAFTKRQGKRKRQEITGIEDRTRRPPPIYIVSAGSGASGEQIVETVLAQFPQIQVPIIKIAHVRQKEQIEDAVVEAVTTGGTIVHTLVNNDLRKALIHSGKKQNVETIDLMGPLLDRLTEVLGREPLGQAGLYRQLHQAYFDRIAAIEFTVGHDDALEPQDLSLADIVLLGVSRCGKTPLSMYLAVQGWKVANIPIVLGIPLPHQLREIDRHRVIGLSIDYEQLMIHRKRRQERMGITGPSPYTKPSMVLEELEAAQKIYKEGGFRVITVTNKPVETIADEVIGLITSSLGKTL
ncbi:MAG TPA: transcriptional regulator [Nitrospiraceae bacterium]|jgi:regulator of PEP synthase PpsR (kinase-PPPase family)|nr:transcriptional regulator [Nitrospiraceae bacterium]